jgi:hypothetical protein
LQLKRSTLDGSGHRARSSVVGYHGGSMVQAASWINQWPPVCSPPPRLTGAARTREGRSPAEGPGQPPAGPARLRPARPRRPAAGPESGAPESAPGFTSQRETRLPQSGTRGYVLNPCGRTCAESARWPCSSPWSAAGLACRCSMRWCFTLPGAPRRRSGPWPLPDQPQATRRCASWAGWPPTAAASLRFR